MNANLVGNLISFAAACFTLASAWSTERKPVYLFQAVQCSFLSFANIFFSSVSGITTYMICAIRSVLLAYDRFTPKLCIVFVFSVSVIGITVNNCGFIGLIPVITTMLYTVICLFAKKRISIKINITVNLVLWAIYDILVSDHVSFAVDTGSAAVAMVSILRLKATPNTDQAEELQQES